MSAPASSMPPPVVWSIAGSDSGGGAGLQADLKAFEAFGVHGCTAVAAITAQHSLRVCRSEPVAPDLLEAQLAALAEDLPPVAIKLGMLGSVDNVHCVARWVDRLRRERPLALVIDPVWRATTGAALAASALREACLDELLPRATIVTPNRAEAAWLLGMERLEAHEVPQAARELRAAGARAVAITGGDAREPGGDGLAADWIDTPQAQGWLTLPRVDTPHHHGTGCVFASSAAAALALGHCEADALVLAKLATTQALRRGYAAGRGAGPVRPGADFALVRGGLPTLHPDRPTWAPAGFAPLQPVCMGLYAIVERAEQVESVIRAGARAVQLRIKAPGGEGLRAEVRRAVAAARAADAQIFINDHWRMALEERAWGVHLGQEDLSAVAPQDLERLRRAGLRLGISTHSYWEVCRARAEGPSYIACGPIHATVTKKMPWRPQGEDNLAYWCHVLEEPVVAIAGMDEARSREAMRCGAAGVAVLRGLVQVERVDETVARLQAAINEGAWWPRRPPPARARPTLAGPCAAMADSCAEPHGPGPRSVER